MTKTGVVAAIKELGLSDYEAEVYVTLLSLGPTTVLEVARKTGMHRTTVYAVVAALKKSGLVHEELNRLKTRIVADDPTKLEVVLEQKRSLFRKALPELVELFNKQGTESELRIYDGIEAVKSVYSNILKDLKPREEYCAATNHGLWIDLDKEFFTKFLERRAELPVTNRILLEDTERGLESKKLERNFNEHIRILPKEVTLNTNLVITPRLLMMHPLQEPITAIVLNNPSFIKMQKEFFEVMWNSSREE